MHNEGGFGHKSFHLVMGVTLGGALGRRHGREPLEGRGRIIFSLGLPEDN